MSHEVNNTTNINNEIEIYCEFAKDLGNNGQDHDKSMTCWIAPEVDGRGEWVYLTTNGDPVVVGFIDEDGDLELADDAREWMNCDDMRWLQGLLADQFGVIFYAAE